MSWFAGLVDDWERNAFKNAIFMAVGVGAVSFHIPVLGVLLVPLAAFFTGVLKTAASTEEAKVLVFIFGTLMALVFFAVACGIGLGTRAIFG